MWDLEFLIGVNSKIYINYQNLKMKQLLSISKERKQKDGKKSMKQIIEVEPAQQEHNFIYQQQQSQIADLDGPTEQQVRAYAEILGIKLPEEQNLLYLARECLSQQTPPDWHCQQDEQGQIIYVNHKTGQVSLEHPCDQIFRQKVISERKKKVNNIKMGMTKINLPKSKTTFLQNVFKAKDQSQINLPIKKSGQSKQIQKANQLQKMIKQNIKQSKIDPQLYDDDIQPLNPTKSRNKPFDFIKQLKQQKKQNKKQIFDNRIEERSQSVSKKVDIFKIKQFTKNKNALLLQNKKKQIAEKLHKKYEELNNDIDKKYIKKIKQMQKQQSHIKQMSGPQLKQKLGQTKLQRRKKQLQMKLMLEYKIQLDRIKLQAERNHSKDMLFLSSKYQVQQLFTQLSQCRKFVNREKLETEKINYIQQIQQNLRTIDRIQIDKVVSQIQKQCRSLMHQQMTKYLTRNQQKKDNQEQHGEMVIIFDNGIQNIIRKYKSSQTIDKAGEIDNPMQSQTPIGSEKQNQELFGQLQGLKKKLRQLQDENNTQRSNLSDKQSKLFDLLQNRVGPASSR